MTDPQPTESAFQASPGVARPPARGRGRIAGRGSRLRAHLRGSVDSSASSVAADCSADVTGELTGIISSAKPGSTVRLQSRVAWNFGGGPVIGQFNSPPGR